MNCLYWLLILLCCGGGSGRSGGCNGNGGGRSGGCNDGGRGGRGGNRGFNDCDCNNDNGGRDGRFNDCGNGGFDDTFGRSGEGNCGNNYDYDRDGRTAPPPVPRSFQNLNNEMDENCGCSGANTL